MANGKLINVSELAVDEWIVFTEKNRTIRGRVVWIEKTKNGLYIIDVRGTDEELHTIVRRTVKRIPSPSVRERMNAKKEKNVEPQSKELKKKKKGSKLPADFERLINTPPEMLKQIVPSMPQKDSTGGIQHEGNHYKQFPIQPVDYAEENKLTMTEGSVVKYVSRHRFSGKGMGDLKKAFHFTQMLARRYYGVEVKITFSDESYNA